MKTELTLSSSSVKIFDRKDCVKIKKITALSGELISFELFVSGEANAKMKVRVESELKTTVYQVFPKKSRQDFMPKKDDYYLRSTDDQFPELLRETDELTLDPNGKGTLFFESLGDKAGNFPVQISVGDAQTEMDVEVKKTRLKESGLINTNWFHVDGICTYYGVKPFSKEFYPIFEKFVEAYAKMGNTMLFVPLFTPPLDTGVGKERMTVQTVKVERVGEEYRFDFSETKKYIDVAKKYGIEYFELSHLFTQWGGECCPKIVVSEDGKAKKEFGWDVKADDERYLAFLRAFLPALTRFLKEIGVFDRSFLHLTDEPNDKSVEQYQKLSDFVRKFSDGIKTIDALSHEGYVEKGLVDLPAVIMNGADLGRVSGREILLYYCVGVDDDYLTNRYLTMPLLRVEALGFQLYETDAKGFLHWGYNYYMEQLTDHCIDPYEDLSAGGKLPEGDCFVVYPGKGKVEYSIRYFSLMRAFHDYRLLKTYEASVGKDGVKRFLKKNGFLGVHRYPRNVKKYEKLRAYLRTHAGK